MTTPEVVTVQLVDIPVPLHARAQEHGEALQRELQLVAQQVRDDPGSVPVRLVELVQELRRSYGGFTGEQQDQLDAAIESGQERLSLTYRVPVDAAAAARGLAQVLDEADDYCRRGRYLLTLATPPELVAYRRWFLDEFVAQAQGRPPTPWGRSPAA